MQFSHVFTTHLNFPLPQELSFSQSSFSNQSTFSSELITNQNNGMSENIFNLPLNQNYSSSTSTYLPDITIPSSFNFSSDPQRTSILTNPDLISGTSISNNNIKAPNDSPTNVFQFQATLSSSPIPTSFLPSTPPPSSSPLSSSLPTSFSPPSNFQNCSPSSKNFNMSEFLVQRLTKRKASESTENYSTVPTKIKVNEEKMSAFMKELKIGSNNTSCFQDNSEADGEREGEENLFSDDSWFSSHTHNRSGKNLLKRLTDNQRLELMDGVKLDWQNENVLPKTVVENIRKPGLQLVLWRPPGGVVPSELKKEEEENINKKEKRPENNEVNSTRVLPDDENMDL